MVSILIFPANCESGGIIPESFPGTVEIIEDKENNTVLHPQYRRYENRQCEHFDYFLNNILARVGPQKTRFHADKYTKQISEIFTALDKEFASFILYNEIEGWRNQVDPQKAGKNGNELFQEKKFSNVKS